MSFVPGSIRLGCFSKRIQHVTLPYLFAPVGLLIPLGLPAAQTDAPDCGAPTTQADTNRCAYDEFLVASSAQAKVLTGLTQGLAVPDRQSLRAPQKALSAWRPVECEFETGGSARELARWNYTAKLARKRTVALGKLANVPEGNVVYPDRKP